MIYIILDIFIVFKTKQPLKLVYAFGVHEKFQEMNKFFKQSSAIKYISLDKPGAFLTKNQAEFLSSKGVPSTVTTLNTTKATPFIAINSSSKSVKLVTSTAATTALPKTEIQEVNINEGDSKGI